MKVCDELNEKQGHVLIETLWNVNAISCRIRNGSGRVLIETLWNVNNFEPSTEQRPVAVLIETLWNVNQYLRQIDAGAAKGFNRNIVECKFCNLIGHSPRLPSFNRNIVECKYIKLFENTLNLVWF